MSAPASSEGRIAAAFVALVVIGAVAMVAIMAGLVDLARPPRLAFITPGQRIAAASFTSSKF